MVVSFNTRRPHSLYTSTCVNQSQVYLLFYMAISPNMVWTSNWTMKERRAKENRPCWLLFEGHGRISGIAVKTHIFFCPSLCHTHTHTHKHRHTHWHTNSLSHSPLQWVIGDVSEPDRYWVSLPRIEWQAKKPFGKEEKVRLWKCAPSWLLILSLTHSSGGPSFDHKQDSQVEIWIFLRKNSTFSGAEKNSLVRTHSWHNSVGFRKVVYEPRQSS